jgi:hypothetical protein
MARRPINKTWTPEDIARLISLAESSATVLRAVAALGRPAMRSKYPAFGGLALGSQQQ